MYLFYFILGVSLIHKIKRAKVGEEKFRKTTLFKQKILDSANVKYTGS